VRRTVWQPLGAGAGPGAHACPRAARGTPADMYIGIGTLIIIIILLIILL